MPNETTINLIITADTTQLTGNVDKGAQSFSRLSGAAGKFADSGVSKAIDTITETASKLVGALDNAGNAFEVLRQGVSKIAELGGPVGIFFGKLVDGCLLGGEGLLELTEHALEAQRQLDLLAGTSAIRPETVKTLQVAAEAIGATYIQVISSVDRIAEGIQGSNKRVTEGIEKLGLSIEEIRASDPDAAFRKILKTFTELPGGSEKAALGAELFGIRASKVAIQAGKSFDEIEAAVKRSGVIIDQVGRESLRDFGAAAINLKLEVDGIKTAAAGLAADTFTNLAKVAEDTLVKLKADPEVVKTFERIVIVILKVTEVVAAVGLAFVRFVGVLIDVRAQFNAFLDRFGIFGQYAKALTLQFDQFISTQKKGADATKDGSKAIDDFGGSANSAGEKIKGLDEKTKAAIKTINDFAAANKTAADIARSRSKEDIAQAQADAAAGVTTQQQADEKIALSRNNLSKLLIALGEVNLEHATGIAAKTKGLEEEVEKATLDSQKNRTEATQLGNTNREQSEKRELETVLKNIALTTNALKAADAERLAAIDEAERTGNKKHQDAALERAAILRGETLAAIAAQQSIIDNDKISKEEQAKAAINLSALRVKLENDGRTAAKNAEAGRVKDLQEAVDLEKSILEGRRLKQEQDIKDIIKKFTEAGVSQIDIIRRVAQEQLRASEEALNAKRRELEAAQAQNKPLSDQQSIINEINKLKIDNANLEDTIKGKVNDTTTSIQQEVEAQQKLTTAIQQSENAIDKLGAKENSLAEKFADQGQKAAQSITDTVKITELSLDDLDKRIADITDQLSRGGTASGPAELEARQRLNDTLGALQQERSRRESEEAAKAATERANAETQANQTALDNILSAVQKHYADRAKIEQEYNQKIKDSEKELTQTIFGQITELANFQSETTQKRAELVQKLNDQELADNKRKNDALLAQDAELADRRNDILSDSRKKSILDQRSLTEQQADIEAKILENSTAAKSAKSADEIARLKSEADQLQSQLEKIKADREALAGKEKDRDSAIQKLTKEAQEKLKNAKTTQEREAIQAELEERIKGVNEKFDIERRADEELARYKGKVSEETLAALRKSFDDELAEVDKRQDSEIEKIRTSAALKQQLADEEEAAKKAAREKELSDFDAQRAKLLADTIAANAKQLDELKKHIADLETERRKALAQEQADFAQSAAAIAGSAGQASNAIQQLIKDALADAGAGVDVLDAYIARLNTIKGNTSASGGQSSSGNQSSGSQPGGGIGSTAGPNNNQTNNNTSGTGNGLPNDPNTVGPSPFITTNPTGNDRPGLTDKKGNKKAPGTGGDSNTEPTTGSPGGAGFDQKKSDKGSIDPSSSNGKSLVGATPSQPTLPGGGLTPGGSTNNDPNGARPSGPGNVNKKSDQGGLGQASGNNQNLSGPSLGSATDDRSFRTAMIAIYETYERKLKGGQFDGQQAIGEVGRSIFDAVGNYATATKKIKEPRALNGDLANMAAFAGQAVGAQKKNKFLQRTEEIIDYVESLPTLKDAGAGNDKSSDTSLNDGIATSAGGLPTKTPTSGNEPGAGKRAGLVAKDGGSGTRINGRSAPFPPPPGSPGGPSPTGNPTSSGAPSVDGGPAKAGNPGGNSSSAGGGSGATINIGGIEINLPDGAQGSGGKVLSEEQITLIGGLISQALRDYQRSQSG